MQGRPMTSTGSFLLLPLPARAKLLAAGALFLALPAAAHEFTAGALTIGHPYVIETPAGARSAAGYFSVTNGGTDDDVLEAVQVEGVEAELHRTETGADGVSRMLPVDDLAIPAGGTVTLEPRGLHVMFMGLTQPWTAGEKVGGMLFFERAGEVPVEFVVEPRGARPADGMQDMHGMHDMPGMQNTQGMHGMHGTQP